MTRSANHAAALLTALILPALLPGTTRAAEVTVGVTASATGPIASIGVPTRNTIALLPTSVGGVKVSYVVLDDGADSTTAVKNARKLISENSIDVLMGSNSTPATLAMIDVAVETGTPLISLAGGKRIVSPMDEKRRWVFKTSQNDDMMAGAIVDHMVSRGVKSVAFIGFADAYGDGWWTEFSKAAEARGLRIAASERYNRTDTSVMGQALKIVAARPDAVLVGASGTPAVLPQSTLVERGYKGLVYHTHGVVNLDFLRVGGKAIEGAFVPVGPLVLAQQLPESHPSRKPGLEFIARYEKTYGPGSVSAFAGYAWDAGLLLQAALPVALKQAQPGTREFREALRAALEGVRELKGTHGVFNMSPTDHLGLDDRARLMATVHNGAWQLAR
jgi:branched-chain amino acid transport system substrate-binding protein